MKSVNSVGPGTKKVEMNFASFVGAKYGRVNPATFNLGSTLVHEFYHASSGLQDLDKDGVFRMRPGWTGPVVDFVNTMRAERGLPLRESYVSEKTAFGNRIKFRFSHIDPRHPEKIYHVIRKAVGE